MYTIFSCFVVKFQINTKVVLRLKKTERKFRSATMSTSVLEQVAHFELFLTFQARNKGEQLL